MFRKVLIANRGEIAVRIIRAARSLGIATVAVYSDADADGLAVQLADEAVRIGPPLVTESYLNQDVILAAAQKTGAEAIHPGYGLLSENACFARRCADCGLIFVGPSPDVLEVCGDKAKARQKARECGLPVIPGSDGVVEQSQLFEISEKIGYPLLLKASAGGGGIGMGLVKESRFLEKEWARCQSRAERAFGCGDLYLEAALKNVQHIEIQVIFDSHGHGIHAFERACSLQRRHQKVIEEAPAPHLSEDLRAKLCHWALKLGHALGYIGLGTIEFLVDGQENAYFIEVNPRLQVEHGITEAVCGLDLVALQLQLASGEPLQLLQSDVKVRGAAIECRLYAEDPASGFLPKTGQLERFAYPSLDGVRVDTGLCEGQNVTPWYDPLLAKVIAFGEGRESAIKRALEALLSLKIDGLQTNRAFLMQVLESEIFQTAQYNTEWLESFALSLRKT